MGEVATYFMVICSRTAQPLFYRRGHRHRFGATGFPVEREARLQPSDRVRVSVPQALVNSQQFDHMSAESRQVRSMALAASYADEDWKVIFKSLIPG